MSETLVVDKCNRCGDKCDVHGRNIFIGYTDSFDDAVWVASLCHRCACELVHFLSGAELTRDGD